MPSFTTAHTPCASREGPTNIKGIFAPVMTMLEKKIENWGNHAFFRDNFGTKYHSLLRMLTLFESILALKILSEKCTIALLQKINARVNRGVGN